MYNILSKNKVRILMNHVHRFTYLQKIVVFFFVTSFLLAFCTGCDADVISMPYGSSDFKNGEWSVEEVVSALENIGFTNITIKNAKESFGEANIKIYNVTIEDTSSDWWFTEYKAFNKGDEFGSWLEIKIETHTFIPTLTVENCSDFANLIYKKTSSSQTDEAINSFMASHINEYIEFSGTITDWHDSLYYISGISFTVAVENSAYLSFSWDTDSFSELGLTGEYDFDKYYSGLISEGMQVHIIAKILPSEEDYILQIDTMNIIE